MSNLSAIERKAREVIGKLRRETLQKGEPFMVYDNNLPPGRYYMEYPDGDIKIVAVSHQKNDFVVHEELDSNQVTDLRRRLELPAIFR